MGRYASQTNVPVDRSISEIKRTLERYGASQFGYAQDSERGLASVCFSMCDRHIRFVLAMPKREDEQFWRTKRGRRSPDQALKAWEQACRQRWRALALCIKAKLEAVESRISEFEDEFLAFIVLPGGSTVGQLVKPQIENAYLTGEPPPGISGLLPAPVGDGA